MKKARGRNHRFSRNIRHSLRDGFNAYSELSPGTGLSCSRRPAARHRTTWPQRREARTTRLRVRAGIVRRRGNRAATRHVHRIPRSTSVTIAKRPSCECGTARIMLLIYAKVKPTFENPKVAGRGRLARRAIGASGAGRICPSCKFMGRLSDANMNKSFTFYCGPRTFPGRIHWRA